MSSGLVRSLSGGLFLTALVGLGAPLSLGTWRPAWLQVARSIEADTRTSTVEVGRVEAPFRVHQTEDGLLRWQLTGNRVERAEADLFSHTIDRPRLRVYEKGAPWAELAADHGRIDLPQERSARGTAEYGQLTLWGGVKLTRGPLTLETERISVWVHRKRAQRSAPGGMRLEAAGRVRLRLGEQLLQGASWELVAASLRGQVAPLRLDLGGPVRLASGALKGPAALAGQTVEGVAQGGVVVRGKPGKKVAGERFPAPEELTLRARELNLTTRAQQSVATTLRAHRAELLLGRAPTPKDAAKTPLPAYRLLRVRGTGDAQRPARLEDRGQGRWIQAPELEVLDPQGAVTTLAGRGGVRFGFRLALAESGAQDWEGQTQAIRLQVERVASTGGAAGVAPSHSGIQVRSLAIPAAIQLRQGQDSTVRLGSLAYRTQNELGFLSVERGADARLASLESGRRVAPWRVRFQTGTLAIRTRRLGDPKATWQELLQSADLRGGVSANRIAKTLKRVRALEGQRLLLRDQRATLRGRPARVQLGLSTLTAARVDYHTRSGVLDAGAPVRWTTLLPKQGQGARLDVAGWRARVVLDADPQVWKEDRARQQEARRAGRRSLTLPGWLAALSVIGRGARRVVATGPRGLRAEADVVEYDRRSRRALLEARADAPPLLVASERGTLRARRCRLVRSPNLAPFFPSQTTWLQAEGAIAADGEAAAPIRLRCGWLEAELQESPQGDAGLGWFAAGGPRGVDLRLSPGAAGKKQAPAKATKTKGRTASLTTRVVYGDASWRLPDGQPGALLLLPTRWSTTLTLPRKGPARVSGRAARLIVHLGAARSGRRAGEAEQAYARRLLASFRSRGGVELAAQGLSVRADSAELDGPRGVYLLRGRPVRVVRGGIVQEAPEWILRLEDE